MAVASVPNLQNVPSIKNFRDVVLNYLENPSIKQDSLLYQFFAKKAEELISLPDAVPLTERDIQLYQWSKQLMDDKQKVRSFICNKLLEISKNPTHIPIPSSAIGKAKWKAFIGEVEEEPFLPHNIQKILDSPCPFWEGKTVSQTHILLLLPHKIGEKELSEGSIGRLVQFTKGERATQYRAWDDHVHSRNARYSKSSYWVLITREVIPGSLNVSHSEQLQLFSNHFVYRLATRFEIITTLFMEYVCHGVQLMGTTPSIYTICQEMYPELKYHSAEKSLRKEDSFSVYQSHNTTRLTDSVKKGYHFKMHQPIVGAYSSSGLEVTCFEYENENSKRSDVGAVVLRELK